MSEITHSYRSPLTSSGVVPDDARTGRAVVWAKEPSAHVDNQMEVPLPGERSAGVRYLDDEHPEVRDSFASSHRSQSPGEVDELLAREHQLPPDYD